MRSFFFLMHITWFNLSITHELISLVSMKPSAWDKKMNIIWFSSSCAKYKKYSISCQLWKTANLRHSKWDKMTISLHKHSMKKIQKRLKTQMHRQKVINWQIKKNTQGRVHPPKKKPFPYPTLKH